VGRWRLEPGRDQLVGVGFEVLLGGSAQQGRGQALGFGDLVTHSQLLGLGVVLVDLGLEPIALLGRGRELVLQLLDLGLGGGVELVEPLRLVLQRGELVGCVMAALSLAIWYFCAASVFTRG
jgi:hypothetical protein